ncbi:hypothetical protein V5O48_013568 [Marasmius crinis-equi]|uniref:Uncharacterized protein n=1 Tax=Marasmius crinis-equi TaxID=585013 RepID=A0ABR3EZQ2_9AGAR
MSIPETPNPENQNISRDELAAIVNEVVARREWQFTLLSSVSIDSFFSYLLPGPQGMEAALDEKLPALFEGVFITMRDECPCGSQGAAAQANTTDTTNATADTQANTAQAGQQIQAPPAAGGNVPAQAGATCAGNTSVNAIVCQNCGLATPLPNGDDCWYCVWRGRRVGWCKGANTVTQVTTGVKGAGYKFCASEEASRAMFATKQVMKAVAVLTDSTDVSFNLPYERGILFP